MKAAGGASSSGSADVHVSVLDQKKTAALGVAGVAFSVEGAGTGQGGTRVGLDYSAFDQAYGGNYGSRLHLVSLPACALTTPQVAACRVQTPLPTTRDVVGKSVSTVLTPAPSTRSASVQAAPSASAQALSVSSVVAATDSTGQEGGAAGSYAGDSLQPSGSWAGGGSAGSFTYQYPITLPGASTSKAPTLGLGYDSGSVDGQTSSTQAQSSWAGDGWSTPDSFLEQTFASCADSPEGTASPSVTNDECYAGPVLTLSLNGSTTSLVFDASKGTYTPADNNGETVTHVTGSNNGSGAYNTDYWTVTDRSGTVYQFGRNQLPGWSAGKAATNSVDTEPVYSAHPGDPCYNAAGFSSSVCTMAYKWHLDYVKDARGQAMSYYYNQDTNFYGENLGATNVSYVRDSYLAHIDYGFMDGGAYGTVPDQVVFTTAPRCTATTCDPLSATTAATEYPDVPFDLVCASGATCTSYGPGFFSTVRLAQITTKQYSTATSAYVPVDTYTLTQSEPATGDGTSPTLWLASVTRHGNDTSAGPGGAITMPAVTFTGQDLQNRVDTTNYPGLYRYRLSSITTELGDVVGVSYTLPNPCTAASVASQDPSTNTGSCYPVYWTPKFYTAPIRDWFQKYAVSQVLEYDGTGKSTTKATTYTYGGGAAWHYDDNELVQAKYRTWGQFHGYATVTTNTGDGANDPQTQSTASFYRGMDGDYLTPTTNRTVTLTDSQGAGHTDSPQLTGDLLESTAFVGAGGAIDHSAISSYWISAPVATRTRTGLAPLTATSTRVAETFTRQALTDGGTTTWRSTENDNTYDTTTGLLTTAYTHTVPVNPAYDQCTTSTYAPANTALNIVGLVASQESDSVACSGFTEAAIPSAPSALNTLGAPASVNRPAQVESATQTFYDDPTFATTFPQTTAPTVGSVTMVRKAADYTGGAFTWQTTARSTYDGYGRPTKTYDGDGNATTTAYTVNSVGLTTGASVTNAKSQTSQQTFATTRGLPLTATDANGIVTTTQYDALGRATATWLYSRPTTAPANTLTTYTVSNTGLSGTTTQQLNDSLGYATSITILDALGRVRQTQTPTPQGGRMITESFYDSRGWVRKTNNPYWDSASLPTLALASFQDSTIPNQDVYTYDGLGRAVVDTSYAYSVVKQTTTTVNTGDTTTVFPPTGGTVKSTATDPLGRTSNVTDYTTPPTLVTPANTFNGTWYTTGGTAASTIAYGYDGHGKQSTTSNAGSTWTTTYNLLGQAVAKSDPDAGTSTTVYDGAGNTLQTTDARGASTSLTYDVLGRKTAQYAAPTSAQSTANESASWVYDNDNAVTGVTNAVGQATTTTAYNNGNAYTTQSLGFNVFGESIGQSVTIPSAAQGTVLGRTYTFKHDYTPNTGLLYDDVYPLAGGLPSEVVTHTYATALDLPAGLADSSYGYSQGTTYDAYGRVTQETIGSSTLQAYLTNTYDPHTGALTDQLVSRSNTGTPTPVDNQAYTYDPAGNLTQQDSTRLGTSTPAESQCYTYDPQDRLSSAWTATWATTNTCTIAPTTTAHTQVTDTLGAASAYWTSWTFTPTGQRATQTQHNLTGGTDTTTTDTYNGNGTNQPHTLTSDTPGAPATGDSYAYDAAGNMTTRTTPATGAQTLTWNTLGQLAAITPQATGASYLYNADGSLLIKTDPGKTTLYLPGEQITLNTTTNTASGVRYIPLPGGGTVVRTGGGSNYNFEITDPHGTADLTLDSTAQTPTWRQFTPYGAPRGTTNNWLDDRGFLNAPNDTTTGLTALGARQYDPNTGAFISLDPLFEATDTQQLNGYTYAANNPIGASDPTGLMKEPDFYGGAGYTNQTACDQACQATLPTDIPEPPIPDTSGFDRPAHRTAWISHGSGGGFFEQAWGAFSHKIVQTVVGGYHTSMGQIDDLATCATGGSANSCANVFVNLELGPALAAVGAATGLYQDLSEIGTNVQDGKYGAATGNSTFLALSLAGDGDGEAVRGLGWGDRLSTMFDRGDIPTGCTNSFPAGTLVLLSDGTTKPIETLAKGDMVTATNPETGTTSPEAVLATIVTPDDQDFTDLTIKSPNSATADSTTLTSTQHHPFWDVTTQSWTDAGHLKPGDQVRTEDGQAADVISVRNYHTAPHTAYNLTIANLHTYYVLAGATPVLVHNDDPLPTQVQGRNQPLTSKQATDLAKFLGYRDTGQRLKGQKIFTNGKTFISQDIGDGDGSHNGGTWKLAKSIKDLGSKSTRTGTYDAMLNKIGC
ncbi:MULTISPECIES: polymorphic toxin-type HINT domain-containing protein [unclassified Kitasatospora]|uniref:polymorphic toxin-type HINT domain-containing protein n=1 Tax=unclassified Kitasatospora TaxID=2633591 RepID=UPI002475C130|nr:polymorphic toxin-type HINT domain-containing protein [Kitasatospora sp. MAP12-44]